MALGRNPHRRYRMPAMHAKPALELGDPNSAGPQTSRPMTGSKRREVMNESQQIPLNHHVIVLCFGIAVKQCIKRRCRRGRSHHTDRTVIGVDQGAN